MSALQTYCNQLIDRLYDLRDQLTLIESGQAGDPRILARSALVTDDKAHQAIKNDLVGQVQKIAAYEDQSA